MLKAIRASMNIPVNSKTLIALGFALFVALVGLVSSGTLVVVKIINPEVEVDIFLSIFLTSLGYIVGILVIF